MRGRIPQAIRTVSGGFGRICKKLRDIEHEADIITHEIVDALNKTFATPLDREDIHTLTNRLDDVVDLVENAASNFVTYHTNQTKNANPELLKEIWPAH